MDATEASTSAAETSHGRQSYIKSNIMYKCINYKVVDHI